MQLNIADMTCESCAQHVKTALERVPGVQAAAVSYTRGRARLTVASGTQPRDLIAAVDALGYRAALVEVSEPLPPADGQYQGGKE